MPKPWEIDYGAQQTTQKPWEVDYSAQPLQKAATGSAAGIINKATRGLTAGLGEQLGAGLMGSAGYLGRQAARGINALVDAAGVETPETVYKSPAQLYNEELARSRQSMAQAQEANPALATGAEIGGALTGAVLAAPTMLGKYATGKIAAGLLPSAAGKLGGAANYATKMLASGAAAAPAGFIYGASTQEGDLSDKLTSGISNAGGAALFGAAARPVASAISPLYNKLGDAALKQQAINAGQILPEKLPKELQKVYARLRADFPDDAEFIRVLNSYASTPDKALIQAAGKRTINLAEGATQYPSAGARTAEFFEEALPKTPEKLKKVAGKTISPSVRYYDDLDFIIEAGRKKAAPLYQQAFKRNQVIESPVVDKILQTPEGKTALGEAVRNIQNEMARVSKPDPELTALAREMGVVSEGGVSKGLKLRALDEVKKAMDSTINQAYRTGNEAEARRIINLKNTLISELDAADKSGFYKQARSVSGDYLSNKNAMESGLKFLTDDKEIVERTYKSLQGAERAAYKNGVVKAIRRQIENTQDGANVAKIFNKPATRDKLRSILNQQEYNRLLKEAKSTDELFKLRNQLTGNSRTAARQIAAEEFDSQGAQIVNDLANKGATRAAIDRTISWVARRFDGLSDTSAKQVANVLYETDPRKKYEIVKFLTNQANMEGSNLRKLQAQRQLEAIYGIEDKVNLIKQTEGMDAKQLQDFLNNYKIK